MHQATREEAAKSMDRYRVFLFAIRVVEDAFGLEPTTEEQMRLWGVVRDVAAGERTLVASPAEAALLGGTPALLAGLQRDAQAAMARERGIAESLVMAAEGMHTPQEEPR